MLSVQDQVEIYILKYKEEIFKHSSNAIKNEELIAQVRSYFEKASSTGDYELQKSLQRLMSPQSLARQHLLEQGIKVSKKRSLLWYVVLIAALLVGTFLLSLFVIFYLVFPYFESRMDGSLSSWEIKYNKNFDFMDTETLQGNISLTTENRFYIDAKILNAKIKPSSQNYIFYSCKFKKEEIPTTDLVDKSQSQINISLLKYVPTYCEFEVPSSILLAIESDIINLEIQSWASPLQIKAVSGNIQIELDAAQVYDFNTYLQTGNLRGLGEFQSNAQGKKIEVYLQKGNVSISPF